MIRLSEKIIALRLATRKATMCENTGKKKKSTLALKTKILFLLRNNELSPSDIIASLSIAKTNLATITSSMIDEGLITKTKSISDAREISYSITPIGREYLEKRLKYIDDMFSKVIDTDAAAKQFATKIDDIINILSLI